MAFPRCAFCSSDGWTHVKSKIKHQYKDLQCESETHSLEQQYILLSCLQQPQNKNAHHLEGESLKKYKKKKSECALQLINAQSVHTQAVAGPGQPDSTAHLHVHWRWSCGHMLDSLNLGVPWQTWNFCGYCRQLCTSQSHCQQFLDNKNQVFN